MWNNCDNTVLLYYMIWPLQFTLLFEFSTCLINDQPLANTCNTLICAIGSLWCFSLIWSSQRGNNSRRSITQTRLLSHFSWLTVYSKMPTVRNARSLVTSRELPSGLQIWGKRPAECIVLSGYNEADTDSASAENVKVIQGRVAHGTLYVRLTCPTMDNRHNKPRSSSRILRVRNFKFNLSTF